MNCFLVLLTRKIPEHSDEVREIDVRIRSDDKIGHMRSGSGQFWIGGDWIYAAVSDLSPIITKHREKVSPLRCSNCSADLTQSLP